jgi:putative endonuclease
MVAGRTVVFVEVKTRSSSDAGHPAEAIDNRKEQRMTQAALGYFKSHGRLIHAARFDVVAMN